MARIIVTTTRRPSPRTRSLVRDLASVIPGAVRLTRGHMNYEELSFEAAGRGAERVLIIGTLRGNPSIMRFYEPSPPRLTHLGSLIIKGVTLSREARTVFSPPRGFDRTRVYVLAASSSGHAPVVAEVLLRGLKARVATSEGIDGLYVIVQNKNINISEIIFKYKNMVVGPRIRVQPPRSVISNEERERGDPAVPG